MEKIKPYTKYRPSGIVWLGDIPEHWEIICLKYLLKKIFTGGTPNTSDNTFWSENNTGYAWVSIADITKCKNGLYQTRKKITEKGRISKNLELLPKGTLLLSIFASLGKTVKLEIEATINQAIIGLEPNSNLNSVYLDYFLIFNEINLKYYSSSNTQDNLNLRKIKDLKLNLPSFQEQTAIANFLDYKTAKIDRFIRKKKQLIKLLNEQKAGIINNAVTKGLNSKAKMKPSGIEWLGDIPTHWEVVKLIGVCGFVRGNSSFKKDELLSNGKYVALQYGKTYKVNEVDENYQFYVNDEFYKVSQIVNCGDIIIVSTSETIQDLGHSVFYNRSDIGLLGGEQILLKPKNDVVNGKYICYASKIFAKELKKYATGVKVYRFNISDLKTIYTSVPPIHEQQLIVEHIEKETTTINKTIATIEKEIALTQEYRTSLIAEAVTGKIDVRDYKVPEIVEEEELTDDTDDEVLEETTNDDEL